MNVREMLAELVLVHMPAVEKNMFGAIDLHFIIDGAGHDITGGPGPCVHRNGP